MTILRLSGVMGRAVSFLTPGRAPRSVPPVVGTQQYEFRLCATPLLSIDTWTESGYEFRLCATPLLSIDTWTGSDIAPRLSVCPAVRPEMSP